jgi:hypothetical protein
MKMKTMRNLTFMIALITAVIFSSCNKNKDENPTIPGSSGSLTLKHNGTSWSASLSVQAVNTNGVVNITGSDSNANQAAINVYQATDPGTYQIGPGANPGNLGRWTQGLAQTDSYMSNNVIGSGQVTFTELSATSAKGTFQFDGYNIDQQKIVVTEGNFSVTF